MTGVAVRGLTLVRRDTAPTAALVVSSHSRRSRSCRRSGSWTHKTVYTLQMQRFAGRCGHGQPGVVLSPHCTYLKGAEHPLTVAYPQPCVLPAGHADEATANQQGHHKPPAGHTLAATSNLSPHSLQARTTSFAASCHCRRRARAHALLYSAARASSCKHKWPASCLIVAALVQALPGTQQRCKELDMCFPAYVTGTRHLSSAAGPCMPVHFEPLKCSMV